MWSLSHNCINLLKLQLWVLWYINYTLIKLFKKLRRRNSDFSFKSVELSGNCVSKYHWNMKKPAFLPNFRSSSLQNFHKLGTLPSSLTFVMETEGDRHCTNTHIGNVQNSYESTSAIDHCFLLGRIYTALGKPLQTVTE